jgi:hypothetical protein
MREEQYENAFDSMRVNSESVSSEIDESDLQYEKHSDWASCTLCEPI